MDLGHGRGLRCLSGHINRYGNLHRKVLWQLQVLRQTLGQQGGVCKIFSVGQLVATRQWHGRLGHLHHRSLRGGHGDGGTLALKHQFQHIGRQDAAFLPRHDHWRNWRRRRRWNRGRNLGWIPGGGGCRGTAPCERRQRL